MNHIEVHIESYWSTHWIFSPTFQFTWQYLHSHFLLSGVCCKVACAKMGGVLQLQAWVEVEQGALFPSQAEVPRIACECRLHLLRSFRRWILVYYHQKPLLRSLAYFSLRTNIL